MGNYSLAYCLLGDTGPFLVHVIVILVVIMNTQKQNNTYTHTQTQAYLVAYYEL